MLEYNIERTSIFFQRILKIAKQNHFEVKLQRHFPPAIIKKHYGFQEMNFWVDVWHILKLQIS